MPRKKRKLNHSENTSFSPFAMVPKDVLLQILGYVEWSSVGSNYRLVNRLWYQMYKSYFLPKKKKEVLELLVGENFTEKLIKENHGIEGAIRKLKEIINFDAILNNLDLQWLNKELLEESYRALENTIIRLERIIWYDEYEENEVRAKWRLPKLQLNEMGMQNIDLKNCGAILIAVNYLKKYGVSNKGYSLIRLYAQAGFDKGVAFLIANGADVNSEDPAGLTLLQGAVLAPMENDPEGTTKCLEVLLFHGAPFPTDEADKLTLIKDMFFYCRLSDFILEIIDIDLLTNTLPKIFKKFSKDLRKCPESGDDDFNDAVDNCDINLTLLTDLLRKINLTLWQRYSAEEITEIKCFPGLCESLTGSDNFEHLIFSEEELKEQSHGINFEIITDEQITLFEKRNLLITLLLMTNKELFNHLEKRDAVSLLVSPSL